MFMLNLTRKWAFAFMIYHLSIKILIISATTAACIAIITASSATSGLPALLRLWLLLWKLLLMFPVLL